MEKQTMRRVLSLWLPQLPLDRLFRLGDPRLEGPFAIIDEIKNSWRLTHVNIAARSAGVAEGFPLSDARAICPDLLTEPTNPMRESTLLRALWRWADYFSPRVAIDPPDGLLLDISGCAHLFAGEEMMGNHIRERLADMHIHSRIGIADTKGAAHALARFGIAPVSIAKAGMTGDALKALPMGALDINAATAAELAQTGLKTIGQLYAIKSSELARRFGLTLTKSLASSLGQTPDPVTPTAADPVYAARMTLPEPIGYKPDMEDVLKRLSKPVCGQLQRERKGARRFDLTVRCVDSGDHVLSISFARPCADSEAILQQFSHPLDHLKVEFGADCFRFVATHIEPVHLRQMVFGKEPQEEENEARLISTLGNRLGFDHVQKFIAEDAHLPELEFKSIKAVDDGQTLLWRMSPHRRPIRLYYPPERLHALKPGRPPAAFEWRRKYYLIKLAKGPERLAPPWHDAVDQRTRDYWKVQTANGPRLWLVTYPGAADPQWFMAGVFP